MHIVIMGCGRTGAALATEFESRGHSVAIIDRVEEAFRRLPEDFAGQRVVGLGFDRETLATADVTKAYGFAAVSSGDNSNILAARVVRETYGVDNVVARINDPGRAEVYRRLGIPTVAPVPWTGAQIISRLLPGGANDAFVDDTAGMAVRRLTLNAGWVGRTVADLESATSARVAYLVRFSSGLLPEPRTVIQDGDEAYLVIPDATRTHTERVASRPPAVAS